MKKLYVVYVEHTVYVMAEDEESAEETAVEGIRGFGDTARIQASEVRMPPVGSDWMGSIPFGADDDRTVSQILSDAPNTQKS